MANECGYHRNVKGKERDGKILREAEGFFSVPLLPTQTGRVWEGRAECLFVCGSKGTERCPNWQALWMEENSETIIKEQSI